MPSSAQRSASQYQVEHTLTTDDKTFTVRLDQAQKCFRFGRNVLVNNDLTDCVENADVHGVGMEIDTTIKLMLFRVKSHGALFFEGYGYSKDSGWSAT